MFKALFLSGVVIASLSMPVQAQEVQPSLYIGIGTGTNLGGTLGVGSEIHLLKYLSVNAALGVWPTALREKGLKGNPFDFDVGIKVYPFAWGIYAGLNYGIIQEEFFDRGSPDDLILQKEHGFTFSLGARVPVNRGIYLSGFAGISSSATANRLRTFDSSHFMPHLGLMMGYAFKIE